MKNFMPTVIMIAAFLAVALCGPGCSSFECSIGAGYRKVPPEVQNPILPTDESMRAMGLTPDQIKIILDFLLSDNFKYLFPDDNRVEVGAWCEIDAEN